MAQAELSDLESSIAELETFPGLARGRHQGKRQAVTGLWRGCGANDVRRRETW